jgi:putative FmdB family regulatory protein
MPNYVYRCERCKNQWEVLKKISDIDRDEECPVCGETGKRLLSSGGHVVFNGEGFYAVDYGTKPRENPRKKYGKGSGTINKHHGTMHADDPVPTKGNK